LSGVPVLDIKSLLSNIDERVAIEVVRQAFIEIETGEIAAPLPGLLVSEDPPGDCHIKYAQSAAHGLIVVKVATGFYGNTARARYIFGGAPLSLLEKTESLKWSGNEKAVATLPHWFDQPAVCTRLASN